MTQAANLAALGTNASSTGTLGASSFASSTIPNSALSANPTFRNRLINGSMLIWQRGTSSTSTGYQTADRWSFYADSSRSMSQSSDAPNGYRYSASLSGTGSTGITQKIESYNVSDLYGQTITVSFWLKQTSGAGSNAIAVALSYATAQDNFGTTTSISTTNVSTTSSWAQYSVTVTNLPSGVINGLQCTIVTTSGSAVAFLVTGAQLELGSVASPFENRLYTPELALCQRYCYVCPGYGSSYDPNSVATLVHYYHGGYNKADQFWEHISGRFPVTMRSTPTITTMDSAGNSGKISVWTGSGGQVSSNQDYYTLSASQEACAVTKYYGSTYGHSCRIKADAEL